MTHEPHGPPELCTQDDVLAVPVERCPAPPLGEVLERRRPVPGLARTIQHERLGVGRQDLHLDVIDTGRDREGPDEGDRVRLLTVRAPGAPDPHRSALLPSPLRKGWKHLETDYIEHRAVPVEPGDGHVDQCIQRLPFPRALHQMAAISAETVETELRCAPHDRLAHAFADLAVALPAPPDLRQSPLQELHAVSTSPAIAINSFTDGQAPGGYRRQDYALPNAWCRVNDVLRPVGSGRVARQPGLVQTNRWQR